MSLLRRLLAAPALLLLTAAAASAGPAPFPDIPYATWTDDEPQYRLFPGDEIDITLPSAPELNKTVTVQPDGRIQLPLIAPQMAADRTPTELERALSSAYAGQLLRPEVEVAVRAQPLKVFVGGEVGKPGVYDMPGDIDALRAIIEAGGFGDNARRNLVVIIRRGPGGRAMMRTVDLDRPLKGARGAADLVPLRRFDIVFVPRTGLGDVDVFMTQVRNALPVNFSYAFGNAAVF
ncbi:MAG: polysaccharide export protein [Caulobacteraceae bacterium]|nr:polysaccharide export protein [Caulobacteraceae bacterium]